MHENSNKNKRLKILISTLAILMFSVFAVNFSNDLFIDNDELKENDSPLTSAEFGDYVYTNMSGDWIIDEHTRIENRNYMINGIINVTNNANLTLENCTLIFDCRAIFFDHGIYSGIDVYQGNNVSINFSRFLARDHINSYYLNFADVNLTITNSNFTDCGWADITDGMFGGGGGGSSGIQTANRFFTYNQTDGNHYQRDIWSGNPFPVFSDDGVDSLVDDYFLIGFYSPWEAITFDLNQAGISGEILVQAWDGTQWLDLIGTAGHDGTFDLTANGTMYFDLDVVDQWDRGLDVDILGGYEEYYYYWLRVNCTQDYTTDPELNSLEILYIDGQYYFGDSGKTVGLITYGAATWIENCTFTDCNYGITTTIDDFTLYANDTVILNNTFINCQRPMFLKGHNFTIIDNTIIDCLDQVQIFGGFYTEVVMQQPMFFLEDSIWFYNHTFSGNEVDGKPLTYVFNKQDLLYEYVNPDDYGQLLFGWCINVTVQHSSFSKGLGIGFAGCNETVIYNNTFSDLGSAICLWMPNNFSIIDNNVTGAYRGIDVWISNYDDMVPGGYGYIIGNNVNSTDIGFYNYFGINQTIVDNSFTNVGIGFECMITTFSEISNNYIDNITTSYQQTQYGAPGTDGCGMVIMIPLNCNITDNIIDRADIGMFIQSTGFMVGPNPVLLERNNVTANFAALLTGGLMDNHSLVAINNNFTGRTIPTSGQDMAFGVVVQGQSGGGDNAGPIIHDNNIVGLYGIQLSYAINTSCYSNNVTGVFGGIVLSQGSTLNNVTLNNITVLGSPYREAYGIWIEDSSENWIIDNTIDSPDVGIQVEVSVENDIKYNTIGCETGIRIEGSDNLGQYGRGRDLVYIFTKNQTDNQYYYKGFPYLAQEAFSLDVDSTKGDYLLIASQWKFQGLDISLDSIGSVGTMDVLAYTGGGWFDIVGGGGSDGTNELVNSGQITFDTTGGSTYESWQTGGQENLPNIEDSDRFYWLMINCTADYGLIPIISDLELMNVQINPNQQDSQYNNYYLGYNNVSFNQIAADEVGIHLFRTYNETIYKNNITGGEIGIEVEDSQFCIIDSNNMTDFYLWPFIVEGDWRDYFGIDDYNHTIVNNLGNDEMTYYGFYFGGQDWKHYSAPGFLQLAFVWDLYFDNFTLTDSGGLVIAGIPNWEGYNVTINDFNATDSSVGITLYDVDGDVLIENSLTDGTNVGIYVKDSYNIEIMDSEIKNSAGAGIYVDPSNSILIENNTIHDCSGNGIEILDAWYVSVVNNTIYNCNDGVYTNNSNKISVLFNHIYQNNRYGIMVNYSNNVTIFDNNAIWYGGIKNNALDEIYLFGSLYCDVINNLIDGEGDDNNYDGIKINGAGVGQGGATMAEIIDNEILNVGVGIFAYNTHANNFSENEIYGCSIGGIYLDTSYMNMIRNNTVYSNGGDGITYVNARWIPAYGQPPLYMNDYTHNNTIYDNAGHGIYLNNMSAVGIYTNQIYDNTKSGVYINDCDNISISYHSNWGPYIGYISSNTEHEVVVNNSIEIHLERNNINDDIDTVDTYDGVLLENTNDSLLLFNNIDYTRKGISLVDSKDNNITLNFIDNCSLAGIYLDPSPSNNITRNTIDCMNETSYGIYVEGCTDVWILENDVINATISGIHLKLSQDIIVENNTIDLHNSGANADGIVLEDSDWCWIDNNTIDNLGGGEYGIYLDPSDNNTIIDNSVYFGYAGIALADAEDCNVTDNYINGASRAGIQLVSSSTTDNLVMFNLILSCNHGIELNGGNNNFVFNNTIDETSDSGVYIWNSASGNHVYNNTVEDGSRGIRLAVLATDNYIYQNDIYSQTTRAMQLNDADDNYIYLNTLRRAGDIAQTGIYLGTSDNNIFYNNTIDDFNDEAFELTSDSDGNYIYNNTLTNIGNAIGDALIRIVTGSDNNNFTQNGGGGPGSNFGYGFIIDNSDGNKIYFQDLPIPFSFIAVLLSNGADNNEIYNCTFVSNAGAGSIGVYISDSNSNQIYNNSIIAFDIGVYIDPSTGNVIQHNDIGPCPSIGVLLLDSDGNTVIDNTIHECNIGVNLTNSDFNIISQNTFYGQFVSDMCGVQSHNNTFDDNDFFSQDIQPNLFSNSHMNNFTNNYFNHSMLYLYYCNYSYIFNNEMENGSSMFYSICIGLENTRYTTILNNTLYDALWMISTLNTVGTIIENNTIYNQPLHYMPFPVYAVNINVSDSVEIRNNTIYNCNNGIGLFNATNALITENHLFTIYNKSGYIPQSDLTVAIGISFSENSNSEITYNRIHNVTGSGIGAMNNVSYVEIKNNEVYNTSFGIALYLNITYCNITNNILADDLDIAMWIQRAAYILIQNNDMSDSNTIHDCGIFVIEARFITVRDNYLENIGLDWGEFETPIGSVPDAGMFLYNVNNSDIVNNTIKNSHVGMIGIFVNNILFENNTMLNVGQNGLVAMWLEQIDTITLRNNTIDGASSGIVIGAGANIVVTENTICNIVGNHTGADQGVGLFINEVTDSDVTYNTIYNCFGNSTQGPISTGGGLVLYDVYRMTIAYNNISFTNQTGMALFYGLDIDIIGNRVHNITGVIDSRYKMNGIGIFAVSVNDSLIYRNIAYDNNMSGIALGNSQNTTIQWNELFNMGILANPFLTQGAGHGIFVGSMGTGSVSINNTVRDNVIYDNLLGLFLMDANELDVINNTMTNSGSAIVCVDGDNIYIYNNTMQHGFNGMQIYNSKNVTITENIIDSNTDTMSGYPNGFQSVVFQYCTNVTFILNTVSNNTDGIYLNNTCELITIYDNEIFNNTAGTLNDIGILVANYSRWINISNNRIWAATGNDYVYGIRFDDTNSSWIEFNTINDIDSSSGAGIFLNLSGYNDIYNNTITSGYYGIYLLDSNWNDIYNNTVIAAEICILIETSNWIDIIDNVLLNAIDRGIYVGACNNTNIIGNQIKNINNFGIDVSSANSLLIHLNNIDGDSNTIYGVIFSFGNSPIITNNTVYECSAGIYWSGGSDGIIANNTIYDISVYGIHAQGGSNYDITENTFNNCDSICVFLDSGSNTEVWYNTIDATAGNGILANVGVIGSVDIYNNTITVADSLYGISINGLSISIDIYNNTITGSSGDGIYLISSSNVNVTDNIISNCDTGIWVDTCNVLNDIHDNTISSCVIGILLENGDNQEVYDNILTGCDNGIKLILGSESNDIRFNSISASNDNGIIVENSNSNDIFNNTINGAATANGINITLTSTNNDVFNNTISNCDIGVLISNADTNYITENDINNNAEGVAIENGADSNEVYLNDITLTACGVNISASDSNKVYNNTIESNIVGVMIVNGASLNEIFNNTIQLHTVAGVSIEDSNNNKILDNEFNNNNLVEIFLDNADSTTIENNEITGSEIRLYNSKTAVIKDNTFNSLILYLENTNSSDIYDNTFNIADTIDAYYAFILLNFTDGNEIYDNQFIGPDANYGIVGLNTSNTIVKDNKIYDFLNANDNYGISFYGSIDVEIRNNTIYNIRFGIVSQWGINNTIIENEIYNVLSPISAPYSAAIYLSRESGTVVQDNLIYNSTDTGITIYQWNVDLDVRDNDISNTTWGIYSLGTNGYIIIRSNNLTVDLDIGVYLAFSRDNYVWKNNISDCSTVGIYVVNSTLNNMTQNKITFNLNNGTVLVNSSFNIMYSEEIYNNTNTALFVWGSWNNTIEDSWIENCTTGLHILNWNGGEISHNNSIYWNIFVNLTVYGIDYGVDNNYSQWRVAITPSNYSGNYWGDYAGNDVDGDGIGDSPYDLIGIGKDFYPLMDWNISALLDTDGDGLSDYQEKQIGTLLNNPDTDGDTLSDGDEWYGIANTWDGTQLNPLEVDSDFDGVNDNVELLGTLNPGGNATNPNNPDTDGDGMTDGEEINPGNHINFGGLWGTRSNATDADSDNDGLNDYWEWQNSTDPWDTDTDDDLLNDWAEASGSGNLYSPGTPTNPTLADTDGDGLNDTEEVTGIKNDYDSAPTNPNAFDTDGDGLNDTAECTGSGNKYSLGTATNPLLMDTDGDGVNDTAEVTGIMNGYDGAATNPNLADTDADGLGDKEEGIAGEDTLITDPNDQDTDNDNMWDGFEFHFRISKYPNGLNALDGSDNETDIDNDGFSNLFEFNLRLTWTNYTNPLSNDTDGDLMWDKWEDDNNLSPVIANNVDTDGDGALNLLEMNAGTNPHDWDSDNDWMRDGWEIDYGTNPLVHDNATDLDVDGLSNGVEYGLGTRPDLKDTDGDTMWDGWEVTYGFNPLSTADAGLDPDADDLTNAGEFANNANPLKPDTDGDGINDGEEVIEGADGYITEPDDSDTDGGGAGDGWEVLYLFDPTSSTDDVQDTDLDQLANYHEFNYGTNPRKRDTDDDTLTDYEEVTGIKNTAFSNQPTNATNADTDGDGAADGVEIAAGTDPNDPLSFPAPGLDPVVTIIIVGGSAGAVAAVVAVYLVKVKGKKPKSKKAKAKKSKGVYVPEEYVYKGGDAGKK